MSDWAGTTTSILNLAIQAALSGEDRIAILDLHESRPAVAKRLGITDIATGLQDVVAGRIALEKAVQPTCIKNLFVITPVSGNSFDSPSPEVVRWILSWLRQHYDVIFVDGPNWQDNAFLHLGDVVFLAASLREASAARTASVARELTRTGVSLRGILTTGVQTD
jgi:Mrp family chromosome partitioning ATPase